jgi:hypothetical protein
MDGQDDKGGHPVGVISEERERAHQATEIGPRKTRSVIESDPQRGKREREGGFVRNQMASEVERAGGTGHQACRE